MKKILLTLFSLIALFTQAQNLRAVADTFTVLQANTDTFTLTRNDTIPAGDSICITLLDTASRFSVLNCNSIIYHPDSMFTGRDTFRYALCDTAHVCDTAMVVVWVDTNIGLLPVAGFKDDSLHLFLFNCYLSYNDDRVEYQLSNTSRNADSIIWRIRGAGTQQDLDSIKYFNGDTIRFVPEQLWSCPCYYSQYGISDPGKIEVCIIAYNQFGTSIHCDTSCELVYEGITEVPLANIHLYPIPADQQLIIDMRQNSQPVSAKYAAIIIYNSFGQKLRSIPRRDSSRTAEVDVKDLSDGIYLATIVDEKGTEMMLGKFTVAK